ncbi:cadherin-like domain-containing protein [Polaromonas sp. P1(28)-13]|nr:cadherin-like domain-containing protein [Polaromonas sp. P1(28)-13]
MEQSFTIDEVAGTQTFTFDPQFIDLKALTLPGGVQLDNIVLTTTAVILAAIAEDSGVRVITQAELLASASDVDNTHAQLSATGLAIATGSGTLADNGNGSWNYTPALNDDTAVSFSYTVTDGSLTAAGIATLDITPVNDAPTTTAVALAAIAEDSGVRVITQAELLANAIDIDSASLTASNLAIVAGLGSLLDNGDGSWSYTPALNDDSTVSFSYTVGDGSLTAAGSATLDLTPVNDAPVANADTLSATEDMAVIYSAAALLGNDTDVDNASLSIASVTSGAGGTAVLNGDGTVSFTPDANFNGAASFSYTASDGQASSNSASVTVNVAPVNDAPVLSSPLADRSFIRGTAFVFAIPAASFTDGDGDSLSYTAALADGSPLPSWLQFSAATGTFTGNPAIPDVGDFNVRVTASDPAGLTVSDVFALSIATAPGDLVGTGNADDLLGTNGNDIIYGLAGDDQLNGGAGNDQLVGGEGNDSLDGGAGTDTMYGGQGDDSYVVNGAGDVIIENAGGGRDLVQSSVSYTLGEHLEDLVLTGTANINGTGNGLGNVLTGNSGNNTLSGGAGNDTLDGGAGRDILIGGQGNDTYVVDDSKDTVNEAFGEGMDTVRSLIRAYTLSANVENLTLLGSAISGTGNALDNVITGNSLSNTLSGGAGNDQLFGLGGNDILTGRRGRRPFCLLNSAGGRQCRHGH